MAAPRILLCGDVLGRLSQLFKRVQSVNASSGPFDALFCVGQFFPVSPEGLEEVSDYIEGRSLVPIPTYFTGDYGACAAKFLSAASREHANRGFKTDGLRVCDNLYWLRGSGKFCLKGLCIAYISGRCRSESQGFGLYSEDDVGALRVLAEDKQIVDIFLSNEWPSGITKRADISSAPEGVSDPSGCDPVISELSAEIKPRYHYAGSKHIFYAREPFLNDNALHVTRFVGLAAVGNKDKQKFIHAISPTPAKIMSPSDLHAKPTGTTLSPYTFPEDGMPIKNGNKRPGDTELETQFWRYDVSQKRQRKTSADGERLCFKFTSTGSCPKGGKCSFQHDMETREQYLRNVCFDFLNKGKCERGPDCKFKHSFSEEKDVKQDRQRADKSCWFCLSSPNVESHLIISVGENYYCALAKGSLVDGHVLVVPIEHCSNTLSLASESDTELDGFKNALRVFFQKQGKAAIFYEFLFQRNPHANLQAVPVPLARASLAERAFSLAAKRLGFEFTVMKTKSDQSSVGRELLREQFDPKSSFFYVELPDGTILSHIVEDREKIPVQFGREVIAGLLNTADKADWRNCKLSKEEEIQMAEGFKKGFSEFDPTR